MMEKGDFEWNFTKNIGLNPEDFTPSSGKKVWWRCSVCGNEWEAYISNRTKGSGCPRCAKVERINTSIQKRIQEVGSLETNFPTIADEWDWHKNGVLSPALVTPGSSRRVWWKCSQCNYEWSAIISNRTRKGQGCPKCAKQKKEKIPINSIFTKINAPLS